MKVDEAVKTASYLLPSDRLFDYEGINVGAIAKFAAALSVKLNGADAGAVFGQKDLSLPELLTGYAENHADEWDYDYVTAPAYSLTEVENELKSPIRLGCLDLIDFMLSNAGYENLVSWKGGKVDFFGEEDWVEDVLADYDLDEDCVMYCMQYIARTIHDLKQPMEDERYDRVLFSEGLSVSAWCETMFSTLNVFELKEDIYYAAFPVWLSFLTSYSGQESGLFWCFQYDGRLDDYIVWRNRNKTRDDELLRALDQAVFVLQNPFLSKEMEFYANGEAAAVLFTKNCGVECINPFFPYAQEVFDTLYPEYLRIKGES